jgi:predicted unusual protein kinase regulating ubiquinone biosynthesis (AarF/ABC1/UbiB family)
MKYGHTDIVQVAGLNEPEIVAELAQESNNNVKTVSPDELVEDLQKLGPTYIKIGQFLSTRPDIIAPQYLTALARLQDNVDPISFGDVEASLVCACRKPFRSSMRNPSRQPPWRRCIGPFYVMASR